jgi:hypothetical protein
MPAQRLAAMRGLIIRDDGSRFRGRRDWSSNGRQNAAGRFRKSNADPKNAYEIGEFLGGDEGARTPDPLLAKQVLYQLSYIPIRWTVFCYVILRQGSG